MDQRIFAAQEFVEPLKLLPIHQGRIGIGNGLELNGLCNMLLRPFGVYLLIGQRDFFAA